MWDNPSTLLRITRYCYGTCKSHTSWVSKKNSLLSSMSAMPILLGRKGINQKIHILIFLIFWGIVHKPSPVGSGLILLATGRRKNYQLIILLPSGPFSRRKCIGDEGTDTWQRTLASHQIHSTPGFKGGYNLSTIPCSPLPSLNTGPLPEACQWLEGFERIPLFFQQRKQQKLHRVVCRQVHIYSTPFRPPRSPKTRGFILRLRHPDPFRPRRPSVLFSHRLISVKH